MQKPLIRQIYKHFTGKLVFVTGIATDFKDANKEIVIYSQIEDSQWKCIPLEDFFTPHPKTGEPRYQLVRPSQLKV